MTSNIEIGGLFFDVSTDPDGHVRAKERQASGPRLVSVPTSPQPQDDAAVIAALRAQLADSEAARAELQARLEQVFAIRSRELDTLLGIVERFKPLVRPSEFMRPLGVGPKSEES